MNKHQRRLLSLTALGCTITGIVAILVIHLYSYQVNRQTSLGYPIPLYSRIVDEWFSFKSYLTLGYVLAGTGFLLAVPLRRTQAARIEMGLVICLFILEIALHTCIHPAPQH